MTEPPMISLDQARRTFAEQVEKTCMVFELHQLDLTDLRKSFWATLGKLVQLTDYWRSDEPMCCVCECTEDLPCPGGCHWIDGDDMLDRCSRCAGKPVPDRDQTVAEFFRSKYKLLGAPGDFGYGTACGDSLKMLYDRFNEFLMARTNHSNGRSTKPRGKSA